MKQAGLLAFLLASVPAIADELVYPQFIDQSNTSGIHSVYKGEWQYMVGGGAAVFDCNDDGYLDIYIAGGENPAKLYENQSARGGALRFQQIKSAADLNSVTGAYPLDINSDGKQDLVVLRVGVSKVFEGLGKCRFREANAKWNVDGGEAWATAFSATWEHGNTWPTLAFGTYIDRKFENEPWGHCTDNWLLRPNKKQTGFSPRLPMTPSYCALSMLFTDWNRSGTPSLRVANDREYYQGGQEQLWKIPSAAPPSLYTKEDGWKFQRFWGMGIAGADVNGDGLPEYMVTSMADQRLQFLADGPTRPTYRDAPFSMGTAAHMPFTGGDTKPSTGWHAQFEDVNNDGRSDLFIVKGNVERMPDFALEDPSNLLLQNEAGNFVEGAEQANMLNFGLGRGGAIADLNMDGKLDVLIVNRKENVRLFRNIAEHVGNWLGLRLEHKGSNLDGIGAWIEVKRGDVVRSREVTIGGGHVSGVSGFWHFGLGPAEVAQVRVIWPGGRVGPWQAFKANGYQLISSDGTSRPWQPSR